MSLKEIIKSKIYSNTTGDITGDGLQEVLFNMVDNTLNAQNITYTELKYLRDNSTLSIGTWYRITDYETTVFNKNNARSAGHPFDILVLATDVNQLSEDAKAIHSARDTEGYFTHANLASWKLKYSLDNDTTKFIWAGDEGKGVIWEMEDEYNNLCPYDFKNVQFKRSLITSALENPSEEECAFYGKYAGQEEEGMPSLPEGYTIDSNDSKFLYTFSVISGDGIVKDNSMGVDLTSSGMGIVHFCILNRMRENVDEFSFALDLNNNVFVTTCNSEDEMTNLTVMGNTFGTACMSNTFINETMENTFGNHCSYNSFGNKCFHNSFGSSCEFNSFGYSCWNNSFGNGCDGNSFGNGCWNNSFGNGCEANSFGNDCDYNSFENGCYSNSFGYECKRNSLGNDCKGNLFEYRCCNNSFGIGCEDNSFGYECGHNSFGNGCCYNSFGNECSQNSFGNECIRNDIFKNVQYITVFDGVNYVSIGSGSGIVQYAQVLNGTRGSNSSNKLKINFETGKNYTQVAGKNSSGQLKIWVPADIVPTS